MDNTNLNISFASCGEILPVEIVFHPSWWNRHAGIVFDEDFFYNPIRRVEDERKMEQVLYDRFGQWGLGADRDRNLPQLGAVHNAAGYLLSEMLGCEIRYEDAAAPQVICAHREDFELDVEKVFESQPFKKLCTLAEALKQKYGYVCGDVNWSGVLNLAMDLKGENILLDMILDPDSTRVYLNKIADVIERFFNYVKSQTGTTSISVNRSARFYRQPLLIHSECSHTMISEDNYRDFLQPIDARWSAYRPYGIHYCGKDPHRYAECFAELPHLDFLDLGWGGDVAVLRKALPETFFNIRLNPVELNSYSHGELEKIIIDKVTESANPLLTGVCCINMDADVEDSKVDTIFRTMEELRKQYNHNK